MMISEFDPITKELLTDAVDDPCGHTYNRSTFQKLYDDAVAEGKKFRCPESGLELDMKSLKVNRLVQAFALRAAESRKDKERDKENFQKIYGLIAGLAKQMSDNDAEKKAEFRRLNAQQDARFRAMEDRHDAQLRAMEDRHDAQFRRLETQNAAQFQALEDQMRQAAAERKQFTEANLAANEASLAANRNASEANEQLKVEKAYSKALKKHAETATKAGAGWKAKEGIYRGQVSKLKEAPSRKHFKAQWFPGCCGGGYDRILYAGLSGTEKDGQKATLDATIEDVPPLPTREGIEAKIREEEAKRAALTEVKTEAKTECKASAANTSESKSPGVGARRTVSPRKPHVASETKSPATGESPSEETLMSTVRRAAAAAAAAAASLSSASRSGSATSSPRSSRSSSSPTRSPRTTSEAKSPETGTSPNRPAATVSTSKSPAPLSPASSGISEAASSQSSREDSPTLSSYFRAPSVLEIPGSESLELPNPSPGALSPKSSIASSALPSDDESLESLMESQAVDDEEGFEVVHALKDWFLDFEGRKNVVMQESEQPGSAAAQSISG